jgi:lipooligosaccharide transport system permease protein
VTAISVPLSLGGRVLEREARVHRRLWKASAFTTFVGPVLFLLAMGVGLGELVDRNQQSIEGLTYLTFVAPGLLAASAAQTAAGTALWPVMGGMKWMRTFHAIVATPIRPADVYRGFLSYTVLQVMAASAFYLVVAWLLGAIESPTAPLAIPAAALGALAFAAPLAAFAATRENDVSFTVIMRIVVQPLFLFSGTVFPVEQLPDTLERLVLLSPLFHATELCRAATVGRGDALALAGNAAFLVAVIAAGAYVGRRTFTRRLAA